MFVINYKLTLHGLYRNRPVSIDRNNTKFRVKNHSDLSYKKLGQEIKFCHQLERHFSALSVNFVH